MQGEEITKLLTDEYAMKILMASYDKEVTALGLSRDFEIPIAACYRRINSLEQAGFMEMSGEKMGIHKKNIKHYTAVIRSATIHFIQGKMVVKLMFNTGEEKTMSLSSPMQTVAAVS